MQCNPFLAVLFGVVVASATAQSIPTWFRGTQKDTLPGPGSGSTCLAVGDVDGDGDLDVVFGTRATLAQPLQQTRLWRNEGHGVFRDVTATALPVDGDATEAVAFADVDGDGDLDLVLGNEGQDRLYRNDGTGRFTDVTASAMPQRLSHTRDLAVGDVDGDGDLDLVLGQFDVGAPDRLYLNNGAGVFTDATATALPPSGDQTEAVLLVDVDGDGDLDLVTGNQPLRDLQQQVVVPGTTRLYRNNGLGVFTDDTSASLPYIELATVALVTADLDGDGDLDLVLGAKDGNPLLYLNDGAGHFSDFSSRLPANMGIAFGLAVGDVDGDGDLDLSIGTLFGAARLLLNDGQARFTDVSAARMPDRKSEFGAVSLADVDGDGDLDLLLANRAQSGIPAQNHLYLNDGSGTFADVSDAGLTANHFPTRAAAVGDLDGDGDPDLVLGTLVYLDDGKGGYAELAGAVPPPSLSVTMATALGDVDGDGDLDLFTGNRNQFGAGSNSDQLFLNNGRGQFTAGPAWPVLAGVTTAAVFADMDGDGDLDLVIARSSGASCIRYNDGAGNFGAPSNFPQVFDAMAVVAGDLDGDGDLDLVFGTQGWSRAYRNDGLRVFTDVTALWLPAQSAGTRALALVDVDVDGDLDLVVGNERVSQWNAQNWLFLNDGSGHFTDVTAQALPVDTDNTYAIAAVDFDLDGDLDLVLGNGGDRGSQQSRLYQNDGAGHFTDVTALGLPALPSYTTALAVADVDQDGDLDLVMGNYQSQSFVLRNQHRQLHANVFPRPGTVYPMEITAMPGYATTVQFAFVGLNLQERTPRLQIAPFGAFGVEPAGMVVPNIVVIPPASGVATLALGLPPSNGLRGLTICAQAVILHSAALQDWRFTNLLVETIQ